MSAYYNEFDEEKAAWIRELIKRNAVAPGEVDERSIAEVQPEDLRGFTQCHFFAGIAVWSYALRLAGWPDDRPVWTGSCPCPSFSCAGKGEGFDDARHLWPQLYRLARVGRPATLFGEQSADAIRHGWWDLVSTDLESEAYAVAAAVLASAGVGASDIRHRLYFVGMADTDQRRSEQCDAGERAVQESGAGCEPLWLADAERDGRRADEPERGAQGRIADGRDGATLRLADTADSRCHDPRQHGSGLPLFAARPEQCSSAGRLADTSPRGRGMLRSAPGSSGHAESGDETGGLEHSASDGRQSGTQLFGEHDRMLPANGRKPSNHPFADALKGFWGDADWLFCTDGQWRPVEAGTFPLAHGSAFRLGRLRGYGDCINAEVARAFIEASWESTEGITMR